MKYLEKLKAIASNPRYSRPLIVITSLLLVVCLTGILVVSAAPAQVEQETVFVSYDQSGRFSYLIYLKPSQIFGAASQAASANPQYPAVAVSTLDFTYSFKPAVQTPVRASVEAVLENPGIWQKKLPLTSVPNQDGDFTLSFTLDPAQINLMFDDIENELGITTSPRTVTLNAVVLSGSERFVQSLTLELDRNLLEISAGLRSSGALGTGVFDYTVNRKASAAEISAAAGFSYPAQIVDYLNFVLNYENSSEEPSAVRLGVDAVLENPGVWQKTEHLILPTETAGDHTLRFGISISDTRDKFAEIDDQTGLSTAPQLVTFRVTIFDGPDVYVHDVPVTIDKGILNVPGNLTLEAGVHKASLEYELSLLDNLIYTERVLRPQTVSPIVPASNLGYDINLKPAPLPSPEPPTTIQPGQVAFARLIDKMDASFSYQFKADRPVDKLSSDVEVIAVIEAPGVWSRTFPVLYETKAGDFSLDFPVDMAGYIALLETFRTETGVSPESYNVSIAASIRTTGMTPYGKIDETFSPVLKGTIKGNVLEWDTQNMSASQPGAIKQTAVVPNPTRYLGMSAAGARGLVLAFTLIFLAFLVFLLIPVFTRHKYVRVSPVEKEVRRIKKKYKTRLIEAADYTPALGEKIVMLKKIEDLLSVADELGKPIIHAVNRESGDETHTYYILDASTRYQYLPILSMKEEQILNALAERLADEPEE